MVLQCLPLLVSCVFSDCFVLLGEESLVLDPHKHLQRVLLFEMDCVNAVSKASETALGAVWIDHFFGCRASFSNNNPATIPAPYSYTYRPLQAGESDHTCTRIFAE